ncbi:MAG: nicotinate (nicotinamide) nucleotide adenylyltransferase [Flavobacteriaceae bacterium]|nr:nicotinate (nicotinamide) nucleotide adenylyltransferase [Flavobacteriaceae bacterium]MCY4216029.1 nicotinate (nicotinamide) nucleotide adenylyltransferase [Flavobacteriaceae bacterium]MCY4267027.1 nicotinate (nicotinamide) nucleotide adenylyltransferase [Flavobacteriaceae bacterium]
MNPFVGCFFGSFNPVHYGHVQVIDNCIKKLDLDEVLVVVSPLNPLKQVPLINPNHRLEMTQLAFGDTPTVTVSDIEFGMTRPSYTIHTLKKLIHLFPNKRLALIIGEDHLASFHLWKGYTQILDLVEVYAHTRDLSFDLTASKCIQKISRLTFDAIPISSTQIRDLIANNKPFEHLVPIKVAHYIKANQLYS